MPTNSLVHPKRTLFDRRNIEDYFISTGFHDLLPLSIKLANNLGYNQTEMINAVCKVYDKFNHYPPTQNRTAWFMTVFAEKLAEARGDCLTFEASHQRLANKGVQTD